MKKPVWIILFASSFILNDLCIAQEMYTNPVINKHLADPFIFIESGYYYLFATGKAEDGRYIPIYKSRDLVTWTFVRGAVARGPETGWNNKNFWAPEVRKFGRTYYLYYTAMPGTTPGNTGNRVGHAISGNIEGPYSDAGVVVPHASIDGHVFVDNDQQMYMFYTIEHGNHDGLIAGQIYADRMTGPDKVAGKPVRIVSHHKWQEGPFILFRNYKYFLTYSCGAWTNGTYHLRYAAADRILGPYEEHPDTLLRSNEMVKGPGHHSFFIDSGGADWIVYHGWDNAFTGRFPRIDRLFVKGHELMTDGPSFTPQSTKK